jgi:hypothetical protein
MKKIILLFALVALFATGNAQIKSVPLFKPVPQDLFASNEYGLKSLENASVWMLRPSIQVTAVQLVWNKETKSFDSSPLSSIGAGISYQHYIEVDEQPFNNFGVNAFLLLGTDISKVSPASLGIATTVNYSIVNVGVGYNFANKVPFILTGVTLKY